LHFNTPARIENGLVHRVADGSRLSDSEIDPPVAPEATGLNQAVNQFHVEIADCAAKVLLAEHTPG
jgi:hypothetical protein